MTKFDPIDLKGDDDSPEDIVTKALSDLTKTMDDRLKDIEEKSDTTKLTERLDGLEAKINRPDGGASDDDEGGEIEAKAFGTYLRLGSAAPADELKALVVSSDTQGGYFAPTEMATEFIRELVEISPVRAYASVRQTSQPAVSYPKRIGRTNAKWKGEIQSSEESEPGFSQHEVVIKELTTHVDISNNLLADSAGMADAEVRMALSEDFGQKEGQAFIDGTGTLAPQGILTAPDIAEANNGHATDIKHESLTTMLYSLPAMYRNAGAWAMNGTTLGKLRNLKDGDGRLLWQPSFAAGQPETILGRPVVEMPDLPDATSGNFPIIYGDWSGYRIVDRVGLSVLVNPYLLATEGMTRIHATRRLGAGEIQAAKFRKFKMSA